MSDDINNKLLNAALSGAGISPIVKLAYLGPWLVFVAGLMMAFSTHFAAGAECVMMWIAAWLTLLIGLALTIRAA